VISYGIYLYHVGVLVFMLEHGLLPVDTGSRAAFLAIAPLASILLGWASYRIVERPCIALGRRLADSRQHPRAWPSPDAPYAASSGG
jgi:peptidoglycan/LPS O-acetylase OafA/YrhL